ncbi:MAG: hypothetical protein H6625_13085 [Bdellovibrionaceae bacterium]|nr:hypothetical protein [Pseudobdellovibrionaceae bacterium]
MIIKTLLAILVTLLTFEGQIWAMSCQAALSIEEIPKVYKPLFDAQEAFRNELRALQSGKANNIKPTPENVFVTLIVKTDSKFSMHMGRIQGVEKAGDDDGYIILSPLVSNYPSETEKVALSEVIIDYARINREFTEMEQQSVVAQLTMATQNGSFISYVKQHDGLKVERGRVVSLGEIKMVRRQLLFLLRILAAILHII